MVVTPITMDGQKVTKADFGADTVPSYLVVRGDLVYDIETNDADVAAAAVAALPTPGMTPSGAPRSATPRSRRTEAERLGRRMTAPDETYTHGHHESVLRSHRWRTMANSAAYLEPHLEPGLGLLDVGCGPGTITVDLARRLAPGRVVGIDREESPLVLARPGRPRRASPTSSSGLAMPMTSTSRMTRSMSSTRHQLLQHLGRPRGRSQGDAARPQRGRARRRT